MSAKTYGMNLDTLLFGIDKTERDLDFLCSLVELPDQEYRIPDAVEYSFAVVALSRQLEYMTIELSTNEVDEETNLVLLTKKQLTKLTNLSDNVEDALRRLRQCGISLEQN
tara:strand:+ start:2369 stop:2701 length:333 start_codon:yes stop_codon:yes gene_type:complete